MQTNPTHKTDRQDTSEPQQSALITVALNCNRFYTKRSMGENTYAHMPSHIHKHTQTN